MAFKHRVRKKRQVFFGQVLISAERKRRLDLLGIVAKHNPKIQAARPHQRELISIPNLWDAAFKPKTPEPPKSAFEHGRAYGHFLTKRGFKLLGSGAHTNVYGKEGFDRVIRVNYCADNWIDFAVWAAKTGWAGNYAPKVFSFKRHKEFAVSVVERLENTYHGVPSKDHGYLFPKLVDLYIHAKDNASAAYILNDAFPKAHSFVDEFTNAFPGYYDMHRGNFMVRYDGSPVLVDPVYGDSALTQKRITAREFLA